jgi:hypothetical protein
VDSVQTDTDYTDPPRTGYIEKGRPTPFCEHTATFGAGKINFFANISKMFRKVKLILGAYCGSVLVSGGLLASARARFLKQKHPLTRKNWNAHGIIPTYSMIPGVAIGLSAGKALIEWAETSTQDSKKNKSLFVLQLIKDQISS